VLRPSGFSRIRNTSPALSASSSASLSA
jgi:hypothetical protein